MPTLLLATANPHKAREMADLLAGTGLTLLTRADFPDLPEVDETGDTFEANARLKAEALSRATGLMALADDSGLCVDVLGGRPGVMSARYAGPGATDRDNNKKLLIALADVPEAARTARFVCVLALAIPGHNTVIFEGACNGQVLKAPRGKAGFGYDPLFLVPEAGLTFAQMDAATKGKISHRARAFAKARAWFSGVARFD